MRICHVGASIPFTEDDSHRALLALGELAKHLPAPFPPLELVDVVNLNNGRDFLGESHKYDVVVTHSIFHAESSSFKLGMVEALNQSKFHSEENWDARLLATEAEFIVIIADLPLSLGGFNVLLRGYRRLKTGNRNVTLFRRERIGAQLPTRQTKVSRAVPQRRRAG